MEAIHPLALNALYRAFEKDDPVSHARISLKLLRTSHRDIRGELLAHPLGDSWFDFAQKAIHQHFDKAEGFIYIAENPQYPEVLKVGKTSKAPSARIYQLNNETVIFKFRLIAQIFFHDRHFLETATHQALRDAGILSIKEFFKATPSFVEACVRKIATAEISRLTSQGFLPRTSSLLNADHTSLDLPNHL